MSFSSKETESSPVEKYYEWKSSEKGFIWYDKDAQKETSLPLPSHIIVLDQTVSITGYSKKYGKGFISNEISPFDLKKTKIRLKTFKSKDDVDHLYDRTEYWSDFKEILPAGAKFTKNLYAMHLNKGQNKLFCIKFPGGAVGPLAELEKKGFDSKKHIMVIKDDSTHKVSGDVEYEVPVLDFVDIADVYVEEAIKMDEKLQSYFKDKLGERED